MAKSGRAPICMLALYELLHLYPGQVYISFPSFLWSMPVYIIHHMHAL